jgi:hypothetical protein
MVRFIPWLGFYENRICLWRGCVTKIGAKGNRLNGVILLKIPVMQQKAAILA